MMSHYGIMCWRHSPMKLVGLEPAPSLSPSLCARARAHVYVCVYTATLPRSGYASVQDVTGAGRDSC